MKLHRLRVSNLAAITNADVEFGPGLNVLYGPNDLGKSTLVSAIRLALLLPHTSTYCEEYVPWTGGGDPTVDLTFETEPQRIWRVKKIFAKSGSSLLQESRNGRDFDDVARARNVDAKLRQILRWGIAEPGGTGGGRGLPPSFLATALLSTQADVTAMLRESLQVDATSSGKERIAAALQAVAQDPLFITLLKCAQARRDEAYTDKGEKKRGKGTAFKIAAERVRAAREEKEELQRKVTESLGTEKLLQKLTNDRAEKQEALAIATDQLADVQRLAMQAADCAAAEEEVSLAEHEVSRIRKIGAEVEAAEATVSRLTEKIAAAELALEAANACQAKAAEKLDRAAEAARSQGADSDLNDTVFRQELQIRDTAADQTINAAKQRIETVDATQKLVDAAAALERIYREQQAKTERARALSVQAADKEAAANGELRRCELLEGGLELQTATRRESEARANVEREAALHQRLDGLSRERAAIAKARGAFAVPTQAELARMRRLAADVTASQRALEVGLVLTVTPNKLLDVSVSKDGAPRTSSSIDRPLDIEAAADVEITIADVATLRVRGGRREAQENARILEHRWNEEALPHFIRAGVTDIDGLETKVGEASDMDTALVKKDAEMEALRGQIASMAGAVDVLREMADLADTCRAALESAGTSLAVLDGDLKKLGTDPAAALRKRRQQAVAESEAARKGASSAATELLLAEERVKNLEAAWSDACRSRDAALMPFPNGLREELAAAQSALTAANGEKAKVAAEFLSLKRTIEERQQRIDAVLAEARRNAEEAMNAARAAQDEVIKARTEHASESALLGAKRKEREGEDLALAQTKLEEALKTRAAMPVPERPVIAEEVAAVRARVASITSELQVISGNLQRAQGALEQVGGAVARERLRDATEALDLAERLEKETEADYEAWKLLLEQMKEADAAQASNLGQALTPAIAERFQTLTQKRYDTLRLTPYLGSEGVVVAGAVRDAESLSVGTREQLSTLYRLCLAEYLQTMIVLDDQLVQSDETRMDWFRALLNEKARSFQIIVFTCRPADYLASNSVVTGNGAALHVDTDDGFIRAIDLGRMLNGSHAS